MGQYVQILLTTGHTSFFFSIKRCPVVHSDCALCVGLGDWMRVALLPGASLFVGLRPAACCRSPLVACWVRVACSLLRLACFFGGASSSSCCRPPPQKGRGEVRDAWRTHTAGCGIGSATGLSSRT